MATLTVPPVAPSPRDDAMQLYRAFKGLGCDNSAVINILAHRDATQRAYIQQEYKTTYSEELSKRLASELRGKLETAVLLWMHDPAARDATIIRQCLAADMNILGATEVICSRTPSQLQYLKQIYHSKFGVHLEQDIEAATTGNHKKILLAYVGTPRHEGLEVNIEIAQKDAKTLYKAGEKKLGTDEKAFIHIFSERSGPHLAAISSYYHDVYGHKLKKAIKNETSGNFAHALLTIIQCAVNPAKYFAKVRPLRLLCTPLLPVHRPPLTPLSSAPPTAAIRATPTIVMGQGKIAIIRVVLVNLGRKVAPVILDHLAPLVPPLHLLHPGAHHRRHPGIHGVGILPLVGLLPLGACLLVLTPHLSGRVPWVFRSNPAF
ncbi:annexin D5-like isoform X2 [Lotus japonicus]|uniref:annexin D5-like isoform X2 n=1 Tax=Lotus japonicus TaxID=34305 RepID=UPI00258E6368|nr:annexin D5-like isoform X2 [Lotus japonicus]